MLRCRFISNSEHIREAAAAFAKLLEDEEEERLRDQALSDNIAIMDTGGSQPSGKEHRCVMTSASLRRTAGSAFCCHSLLQAPGTERQHCHHGHWWIAALQQGAQVIT